MDIYIAKQHIDKLLNYVEDIAENKPNMYQKSKVRLKNIADTCAQVVSVISEILEDEALNEDDFEIGEQNQGTEIIDAVKSMQNKVNALREFVDYSGSKEESNKIDETKLSSADCKHIMMKYRKTLYALSKQPTKYPQAHELANILHEWFETRFYKSMGPGAVFRYNLNQIPRWIYSIITVYGNHVQKCDSSDFKDDFRVWLTQCDAESKFAVPLEVYKHTQQNIPETSVASVVIWDILYNIGLFNLSVPYSTSIYLKESEIFNMCDSQPDNEDGSHVMDHYRYYEYDPSVLTFSNIETEEEVQNED